jgi:hypothetical protein
LLAHKLQIFSSKQTRKDKEMSQEREEDLQKDELDSQLGDVGVDSADIHGNVGKVGYDYSLARSRSDYDEDSGPGGASGIGDDPTLQGSTGIADDVGMHVEPGFSVGYDQGSEDAEVGPDTGNETEGGGYLSLGEAAQGFEGGRDPDDEVQTALGVGDVGGDSIDDPDNELSLESIQDEEGGYGAEGTDSDLEGDQAD